MKLGLEGKGVLVTGSSKGIGRAIANTLLDEGCRVVFHGRDEVRLKEAVHSNEFAVAVRGDVATPDGACNVVEETVSILGGLDILVCNVGGGASVPPGEESFDEWQRVFALNLWSATNAIEAARDALVASKGVIVCVSSICGLEVVSGAPVTYSAAKAALHAYVRGIARPFGKDGVRINAVAPGNILFDGSVWQRKLLEDSNAVTAMLRDTVSLRRFGEIQDVANLVVYLASPQCGFATGGIWTIDGGQVRS